MRYEIWTGGGYHLSGIPADRLLSSIREVGSHSTDRIAYVDVFIEGGGMSDMVEDIDPEDSDDVIMAELSAIL